MPVVEGLVGLKRRKDVEIRFVVLSKDCLEYYKSKVDRDRGEKPRGRVQLDHVYEVQLGATGFTFVLDGQELTLVVGETALQRWTQAIKQVVGEKIVSATIIEGRDGEGTPRTPNGPDFGPAVHQGSLGVVKRGVPVERYFVLTRETFSYWERLQDYEDRQEPRGCVALDDISRFEETMLGFDMHVQSQRKPLQLKASSDPELEHWLECWKDVIGDSLGDAFDVHVREKSRSDSEEDQEEESSSEREDQEDSVTEDQCTANDAVDADVERNAEIHKQMDEATSEWCRTVQQSPQLWQRKKKGLYWSTRWTCVGCGIGSADNPRCYYKCADAQHADLDLCEACYSRFLQAPSGAPDVLCTGMLYAPAEEGLLSVRKNKKRELIFVALGSEELRQYKEPEDFLSGRQPLVSEALAEVAKCEVTDSNTIVLQLKGKAYSLEVAAAFGPSQKEDATRWGRAFESALSRFSVGVCWGSELAKVAAHERGNSSMICHDAQAKEGREVQVDEEEEDEEEEEEEEEKEDASEVSSDSGTGTRASTNEDSSEENTSAPGEIVLCQGPLLVGQSQQPTLCILYRDRLDIKARFGLKTIRIADIQDVDIADQGFTIIQANSPQSFEVPDASRTSLQDWLDALTKVCEGDRDAPAVSPRRRASIAPGEPETVGLVPFSDRKLWEVFERCGSDVARTGHITKGGLLDACRNSALISDFFGIDLDIEAGIRAMESKLRMVQVVEPAGGKIDWDDFKDFYRLWAPAESDDDSVTNTNEVLQEGPLRVMRWPGQPLGWQDAKNWGLIHVKFDPVTGDATLRKDFGYERRRYSPDRRDPTTAVFEDPHESAAALEELAGIFKRFHSEVTVVYRFKKPPRGIQSPEHQQWLFNLCVNRLELIRVELEELGVSGELLLTRLEHATDGEGPTHYFEFDTRAQVRHLRVFPSRVECLAPGTHAGGAVDGCIKASSVRSIRLVDDGFALGLASGESLEVQLLPADSLDPWIEALKVLASRGEEEQLQQQQRQQQQHVPKKPPPLLTGKVIVARPRVGAGAALVKAAGPIQELDEVQCPRLAAWLASLSEPVKMRGELHFEEQGQSVTRFCVLFEDRLEAWGSTDDAVEKSQPQLRILVHNIKSLDTTLNGLAFNLREVKLGVQAPSKKELRLWSQAFLSVLPGNGGAQTAARQRQAKPPLKGVTRSRSASPASRQRKEAEPSAPPEPKKSRSLLQSLQKGFVLNTHRDARQARAGLHGQAEALVMQPSQTPGGWHVNGGVSTKINERDPGAGRRRSSVADASWVKVNHVSHRSGAGPTTSETPRRQPSAPSAAARSSASVTEKVKEAGMALLGSSKRTNSAPAAARAQPGGGGASARGPTLLDRQETMPKATPTKVSHVSFGDLGLGHGCSRGPGSEAASLAAPGSSVMASVARRPATPAPGRQSGKPSSMARTNSAPAAFKITEVNHSCRSRTSDKITDQSRTPGGLLSSKVAVYSGSVDKMRSLGCA